jgi:hypothetical protein
MKRARHLIVPALLCVASAAAEAQEWRGSASIALEVKGKPSGNVAEALVVMRFQQMDPPAGPRPVLTDTAGRAVIADLAEGVWEVEVSHQDFLSFVALVLVRNGKKPAVQASFLQASGSSLTPIRVKFQDGKGKAPSASVPLPPEAAARLAQRRPPPPARAPTAPAPESPRAARPPPRPPETVMPEPELRPLPATAKPAAAPAPPPPTAPEQPLPQTAEPAAPPVDPAPAEMAPPAEPPLAAPTPAPKPEPEPEAEAKPEATPPAPQPAAPLPAAQPMTEAPVPEAPMLDAPMLEAPMLEAPVSETPVPETSVPETPGTEAPAPEPTPPAPAEPPAPEAPALAAPQPIVPEAPARTAEPMPEPVPAPVAPDKPPAPRATPTTVEPAPGPLGPTLRAYRDNTCVECRPGEFAISVETVIGPAKEPCSGSLEADGRELAALLGSSIALEIKEIAAPAAGAVSLMGAGESTARVAELLGSDADACRLVAVVIPKAGRFRGARLEAADATGVGDCLADRPCPVGQARWVGQPRVAREPSANVIWSLFVNEAPDRARRARLTVYFAAPYRAWDPPR